MNKLVPLVMPTFNIITVLNKSLNIFMESIFSSTSQSDIIFERASSNLT